MSTDNSIVHLIWSEKSRDVKCFKKLSYVAITDLGLDDIIDAVSISDKYFQRYCTWSSILGC